MATRVAINGLGRIGRATLRLLLNEPALEVVAINDIASPDNLAYLLRYDTVYGRLDRPVSTGDSSLTIGNRSINVFSEQDPSNLPWSELGVELVFECTGRFTTEDGMRKHLQAGAKKVVLSAPLKSGNVKTVVYGVNHGDSLGDQLVSCASCTTTAITPVIEILDRHFGVKKATMTTVHAYTASQGLVDGPAKKWRRGRAAAANIVPTNTGAAQAASKAYPAIGNRFDGSALRVPVAAGSIAVVVCVTNRPTSVDEVNRIFREEAAGERYHQAIDVSDASVVSSDIVGEPRGSIIDMTTTQVVDGDLVSVMTWYDNEMGYASQMVNQAMAMVRQPALATA